MNSKVLFSRTTSIFKYIRITSLKDQGKKALANQNLSVQYSFYVRQKKNINDFCVIETMELPKVLLYKKFTLYIFF